MMAALGGIELEEVRVAFGEWPEYLKSKSAYLIHIYTQTSLAHFYFQ